MGFEGFQKYLRPCALDESSFSIGMVSQEIADWIFDMFDFNFWNKISLRNI